ncbi:MAG: DUF1361 domain-containing protein [Gilvibacter sp.]
MKFLQLSQQSKTLLILTGLSLATVVARIFATEDILYLFLIWNLFLAALPYTFAKITARHAKPKNLGLRAMLLLGFWLLFLPNSFYIVTDLIHLKRSQSHLIYFDLLMIASFAITGLMYGYYSIQVISKTMASYWNKTTLSLATLAVYLLCGFGIYLGRVLRWNSWDIITQPAQLFRDIAVIVLNPLSHLQSWGITIGFGVFLYTLHLVMQRYSIAVGSKNL